MSEDFIRNNFEIIDEEGTEYINWGNGVKTEISKFLNMFNSVDENVNAIKNHSIDKGYGFELFLN